MSEAPYLTAVDDGVLLDVLVVPRASRTQIVGPLEDRLKIQLNAPPVDGAANQALVRLLAKTLGIKKSDVRLESGESGRRKRLRLLGVTLESARSALL